MRLPWPWTKVHSLNERFMTSHNIMIVLYAWNVIIYPAITDGAFFGGGAIIAGWEVSPSIHYPYLCTHFF